MTMKKSELEKRAGMRIALAQRQAGNRYGPAVEAPANRRAQRDRDRAAGLVPYAVKLPGPLVAQLSELARQRGVGLNELTAELLQRGVKD